MGYSDHTSSSVLLYLQQSFTFRVLSPEAAVPLTYPAVDVTAEMKRLNGLLTSRDVTL